MTERFAQLTYTSYDNGAGRGGWQVKEIAGALSPAEQETLVNRVVTVFDLDPRLPDFPSGDDLAKRPARLARERLPDGSVAMWHTVEAGRDGSGRPGNVFAHVVLDRGAPTPGENRPIALWKSTSWLQPYGPDGIAAATLSSAVPAPNPSISTASAIDFVIASMERQAVFRILMDAVLGRLDGGPAVVLRVADHEQAVAWISAVSHFLPQSIAHRLTWSTHDRHERAVLDVANGVDLIAVPTSEALDGGIPGAVVVSPQDTSGLAMPGGRHQLSSGGTVVATTVSSLLEGVLFDPSIASEVLRRQEEIDNRFPHDEARSASWLMAVGFSIVLADMDDPDMADFTREAERLIASGFPASAMDDPQTGPLIAAALIHHPMSARDSLGLLQRSYDAGRPTADLAVTYLTAALTDGSWRQVDLSSIPKVNSADLRAIRPQIDAAIAQLCAELRLDPPGMTPWLLVFAEVICRLGASIDEFYDILAAIDRSAVGLVPTLVGKGPYWPREVPVTAVRVPIYAQLVLPRLAGANPADLLAIIPGYWNLYGVPMPTLESPLSPPNPTDQDRAVLPYAGLAFLRDTEHPMTDNLRREVARDAIDMCLGAPRNYVNDIDAQALTRELLVAEPSMSAYVPRWTQQAPNRMSGDVLYRAIFANTLDTNLLTSLADPRGSAEMSDVAAAARVRLLASDMYAPLPPTVDLLWMLEATLPLAARFQAQFAPELAEFLDASLIAIRELRRPWTDEHTTVESRLLSQNAGRDSAVARQLIRYVDARVLTEAWTAGKSYLGETEAHRLGTKIDGEAVIARLALDQLRTSYRGPLTVEELRDACWPILARGTAGAAEEFFQTYRKSGAAWLRTNIPEADVQRRLNR